MKLQQDLLYKGAKKRSISERLQKFKAFNTFIQCEPLTVNKPNWALNPKTGGKRVGRLAIIFWLLSQNLTKPSGWDEQPCVFISPFHLKQKVKKSPTSFSSGAIFRSLFYPSIYGMERFAPSAVLTHFFHFGHYKWKERIQIMAQFQILKQVNIAGELFTMIKYETLNISRF